MKKIGKRRKLLTEKRRLLLVSW